MMRATVPVLISSTDHSSKSSLCAETMLRSSCTYDIKLTEWSQYEQCSIPTPFGRCLLASTMCRGDPLLIGLERPVTTEIPLYCVRVQFLPQCLCPCVVLSLQTRNRWLQFLDTIPDKLVGRNRSTFPAFLGTAGTRTSSFLSHS